MASRESSMLSYILIVMTCQAAQFNLSRFDNGSVLWLTVSVHGANLRIMLQCWFLWSVMRTLMGVYRGTRIRVD